MRRAKKRKAPCNIPMTLAGILFCLTLISIHFTGGLYARYTTSAAASDSARVVTFGQVTLTETVDGNTIHAAYGHIVAPGVDINKDVNVAFTACEVDTYIFVEITAESGWTVSALNFTAGTAGNGNPVLSWSVDNRWTPVEGEKGVYYKYVDTNTDWSAEVIAGKTITVNPTTTAAQLADVVNCDLEFRAIAVQAGGFENAKDAWNAVGAI